MGMLAALFRRLVTRAPRVPQPGQVLSRFIAPDVRRDILVIATDRLGEGVITARVRTTNLLYVSRGLMPQPDFEPPRDVRLDELWKWTGQRWGGLADGSSVLGLVAERAKDAGQATGTDERVPTVE